MQWGYRKGRWTRPVWEGVRTKFKKDYAAMLTFELNPKGCIGVHQEQQWMVEREKGMDDIQGRRNSMYEGIEKRKSKAMGNGEKVNIADSGYKNKRNKRQHSSLLASLPICWLCRSVSASSSSSAWSLEIKILKTWSWACFSSSLCPLPRQPYSCLVSITPIWESHMFLYL